MSLTQAAKTLKTLYLWATAKSVSLFRLHPCKKWEIFPFFSKKWKKKAFFFKKVKKVGNLNHVVGKSGKCFRSTFYKSNPKLKSTTTQ